MLIITLMSEAKELPSFDCKKASTNVEKMICDNELLSRYDQGLSKTYRQLLTRSQVLTDLKQAQRQWLKATRNQCTTQACLIEAYARRYRVLKVAAAQYYSEQKSLDVALRLARDGDPMTGMWFVSITENTSGIYLIEALEKNQYSVKACGLTRFYPTQASLSDDKLVLTESTIALATGKRNTQIVEYRKQSEEALTLVSPKRWGLWDLDFISSKSDKWILGYLASSCDTLANFHDGEGSYLETWSQLAPFSVLADQGVDLSSLQLMIYQSKQLDKVSTNHREYILMQVQLGFPRDTGVCGGSLDAGIILLELESNKLLGSHTLAPNHCRHNKQLAISQGNDLWLFQIQHVFDKPSQCLYFDKKKPAQLVVETSCDNYDMSDFTAVDLFAH